VPVVEVEEPFYDDGGGIHERSRMLLKAREDVIENANHRGHRFSPKETV